MSYPETPGWKDNDTSRQAAMKVLPKSKQLQSDILAALETRNMSCEQLAEHFNLPITSIRPRVTELLKQGKIQDSGIRRRTEGGCMAKVWIINQSLSQPPIQYTYDSSGQGALFNA